MALDLRGVEGAMQSIFNSKLSSFDPYLTYTSGHMHFVRSDGKPTMKGYGHIAQSNESALWRLGRNAFEALPKVESREAFHRLYQDYLRDIQRLGLLIAAASTVHTFVFTDADGSAITPDFDELPNSVVLDIGWQLTRENAEIFGFFKQHFLFACLELIDSAIVMLWHENLAIPEALEAANAYGNYQAVASGNESLIQARSELAVRAVTERLRRDPKQDAKRLVKECWLEWQKKPERYSSQAAFAMDVLSKVQANGKGDPIISFDTIVKKWLPQWKNE